jgi:oligoendopeptidase F
MDNLMIEALKIPDRADIPVEHTWDLTPVYANDKVWEQAVVALEAKLPEISALQGKIGAARRDQHAACADLHLR